jgi:hypothetical protein
MKRRAQIVRDEQENHTVDHIEAHAHEESPLVSLLSEIPKEQEDSGDEGVNDEVKCDACGARMVRDCVHDRSDDQTKRKWSSAPDAASTELTMERPATQRNQLAQALPTASRRICWTVAVSMGSGFIAVVDISMLLYFVFYWPTVDESGGRVTRGAKVSKEFSDSSFRTVDFGTGFPELGYSPWEASAPAPTGRRVGLLNQGNHGLGFPKYFPDFDCWNGGGVESSF